MEIDACSELFVYVKYLLYLLPNHENIDILSNSNLTHPLSMLQWLFHQWDIYNRKIESNLRIH